MTDASLGNGFREDLLCHTSGWCNNCGLNCLTHFIFSKLETQELQIKFATDPEYQALLKTFQQYYLLPEKPEPTWGNVYQLLAPLCPADREVIFAPVLRKHLSKIMKERGVAEALWNTDCQAAISQYMTEGRYEDIAIPVYMSNKDFFNNIQAYYKARMADPYYTEEEKEAAIKKIQETKKKNKPPESLESITQNEIIDQCRFTRDLELTKNIMETAKEQWITEKCHERYADYIGDLINQQMISVDHLDLLCKKLHIGAEIYMQQNGVIGQIRSPNAENSIQWNIKIVNSGAHWEYEEPTGSIEKQDFHNINFDKKSLFDFSNKLIQTNLALQLTKINDHVQNNWKIKLSKSESSVTSKKLQDETNEAMNFLLDKLDDKPKGAMRFLSKKFGNLVIEGSKMPLSSKIKQNIIDSYAKEFIRIHQLNTPGKGYTAVQEQQIQQLIKEIKSKKIPKERTKPPAESQVKPRKK